MKARLPTSSQPEVTDQRIYGGGRKAKPLSSFSQPEVLPNTRVYGSKKVRTIRVRLKADRTKRELLIPFADFNPVKHVRVE